LSLGKITAYPGRQAKTLCPVATPGCACLPPAGAFTIWVCWYLWLLLKFCSDFTTKHMRPPRPFVLKWRYAEVPWLENRRYVQALTSENLAQA